MRGKMYDCENWSNFEEKYKNKEDIIGSDGKRMPYTWYVMEYGEGMAASMLETQRKKKRKSPDNRHSIQAKKDFTPREKKHKQKAINGQFLALPFEKFFNNEELMKKIANKTGLLLVLLKNFVDWDKNEKLNLYQEYFVKRKLLVASISRPRLAKMFGRDKRRITAWVKKLEKDGLLKIERISCLDDDDHRKKYNVYILGEVDDAGNKTFYYEK